MVSPNLEIVTKQEFVRVHNPFKREGVVHFYEFIKGANPGVKAGFVKISEPRIRGSIWTNFENVNYYEIFKGYFRT